MEIKNTKAAIDVMQGYDIKINACISIILVIFAVSFVLILFVKKEEKNSVKKKKNIFKRDAIIVLAAVCVFYFGYFLVRFLKHFLFWVFFEFVPKNFFLVLGVF